MTIVINDLAEQLPEGCLGARHHAWLENFAEMTEVAVSQINAIQAAVNTTGKKRKIVEVSERLERELEEFIETVYMPEWLDELNIIASGYNLSDCSISGLEEQEDETEEPAAPSTADAVDTADTADATDVAGGADTDTVDTVDTAATATTAATTDIAEGAGVEEEDATAATAATTDLAEGAGVEEDVAAAAMGEDAELPSSLSRFRKLAKSPAKSMKTAKKVLQARTNKPLKSSSDTGMV
jgi:hypothetical protein